MHPWPLLHCRSSWVKLKSAPVLLKRDQYITSRHFEIRHCLKGNWQAACAWCGVILLISSNHSDLACCRRRPRSKLWRSSWVCRWSMKHDEASFKRQQHEIRVANPGFRVREQFQNFKNFIDFEMKTRRKNFSASKFAENFGLNPLAKHVNEPLCLSLG